MSKIIFTPRVRTIPFDIYQCIKKYKDVASLIKILAQFPGGMSYALTRLGLSIGTEYAEMALYYLHDRCSAFNINDDVKTFIRQEANHGRYHHALNKFIEPNYTKVSYGPPRVSYLLYPHVAQDELVYKKIEELSAEDERAALVKDLEFKNAVFESQFGILGAIGTYQMFEDHFDDIKNICPVW